MPTPEPKREFKIIARDPRRRTGFALDCIISPINQGLSDARGREVTSKTPALKPPDSRHFSLPAGLTAMFVGDKLWMMYGSAEIGSTARKEK